MRCLAHIAGFLVLSINIHASPVLLKRVAAQANPSLANQVFSFDNPGAVVHLQPVRLEGQALLWSYLYTSPGFDVESLSSLGSHQSRHGLGRDLTSPGTRSNTRTSAQLNSAQLNAERSSLLVDGNVDAEFSQESPSPTSIYPEQIIKYIAPDGSILPDLQPPAPIDDDTEPDPLDPLPSSVPEPSALALVAGGLGLVFVFRRRL